MRRNSDEIQGLDFLIQTNEVQLSLFKVYINIVSLLDIILLETNSHKDVPRGRQEGWQGRTLEYLLPSLTRTMC